jgi:hypothetical protein
MGYGTRSHNWELESMKLLPSALRRAPRLRWATVTSAPTPCWMLSCTQTQACPLSHSLPTAIQLAIATRFANGMQLTNNVQVANRHSLPIATQLANGVHCLLPQLTSCHRGCQRYTACQLPHSSLMIYRLPTVHSLPSFCRSYQSRGNSSR